jgi:hypothetical protein
MRDPLLTMIALASAGLAAGGCGANNPTYFEPAMPLEVGQPGSPTRAASLTVAPTYRPPDGDEQRALDAESAGRPVRAPWIRTSEVALQLQYTLRNLSDKAAVVRLSVDGASEFASYDAEALRAAALMANPMGDQPTVFSLIQPTPIELRPNEVKSGVIREDDFAEAALDLEAIGRYMTEPTSVLINRSDVSPVGLERVDRALPLPQLVQVKVGLAATAHVHLEVLLRVRDQEPRLQKGGDGAFAPMPTAYAPPAMMMRP